MKMLHTFQYLGNDRIQTSTAANEKRVGGTWFGGFESSECPAPEGFVSSGGFGGAEVFEARRFPKRKGFRGAEKFEQRFEQRMVSSPRDRRAPSVLPPPYTPKTKGYSTKSWTAAGNARKTFLFLFCHQI